jgi:hypothetical protein
MDIAVVERFLQREWFPKTTQEVADWFGIPEPEAHFLLTRSYALDRVDRVWHPTRQVHVWLPKGRPLHGLPPEVPEP